MNTLKIVSRDEWLVARAELLAKEKAATHARDRLNAARRQLPMVKMEKEYLFEGPNGQMTLADLFDGRRQLIIYHFMFDPSWVDGCPSCTYLTNNMPPWPAYKPTIPRWSWSPVLLWRSLRTTRRARTGPFPGSPRLAANSTTTSMSRTTRARRLD